MKPVMKKIFIPLLIFFLLPSQVFADRLYGTGFELQSTATGIEYSGALTGTCAISTATFRSGVAALRCNPSAATGFVTHRFRADATTRYWDRFAINVASYPLADETIWDSGDGSFQGLYIEMTSTGVLQLLDGGDASQIGSNSDALSLDTWYVITVDYNDASLDACDTTIDGVAWVTGGTCANVGGGGVSRYGVITTGTADIYYDDIIINDSANTTGKGLNADPSVTSKFVHSWANEAGDNAPTAGDCTLVDENPPADNDADDMELDETTTIADCNAQDSSTAGIDSQDTITSVSVQIYIQEESAGVSNYIMRLKSAASGTATTSSAVDAGGAAPTRNPSAANTFRQHLVIVVDPTTLVAWTPTGTNSIDNMQIGVATTDGTPDTWVDTLWVIMEYEDVAAPAAATGGVVSSPIIWFNDDD